MTTPEQRLFAAQQVYPDITWSIEAGEMIEGTYTPPTQISEFKNVVYPNQITIYSKFDPENNAEQWRDVWRWVMRHEDFRDFEYFNNSYLIGFFSTKVKSINKYSVSDKSDTEALILAVCALGGFDG